MTEQNKESGTAADTSGQPSTAAAKDPAKAKKTARSKRPKPPGQGSGKLVWLGLLLILLLVLGALAGFGYWGWQQYEAQNTQLAELRNAQSALQQQLGAAQKQMQQVTALNSETKKEFQSKVQSVEDLMVKSAQRMNRQANRTESRWPLEEALTLTRLAAQRLQLDARANVAVGLLKSADKVLAGLDQAAVLPLRRQLASDILALQSTAAVDIHGAYFRLEAVADKVKALTWVPKPSELELPSKVDTDGGFWSSLKNVIVVSRLDTPLQAPPVLSDFEQWRQRLLLLIEQVKLALLARNQALFDEALAQTQEQLTVMSSQFDLSAMQSSLQELNAAVLNPQWPSIDQSATLIEQYLAEQSTDGASDSPAEEAKP